MRRNNDDNMSEIEIELDDLNEFASLVENVFGGFFDDENQENQQNTTSKKTKKPKKMTETPLMVDILPLRDTIIFPEIIVPINASRDSSKEILKKANKQGTLIGVVAQKDHKINTPTFEDIYKVGVLAKVLKTFKLPDGNLTAIIQGVKRFEIVNPIAQTPYLQAEITDFNVKKQRITKEISQNYDALVDLTIRFINEDHRIPKQTSVAIENIKDPLYGIGFIASNLYLPIEVKQKVLQGHDILFSIDTLMESLNIEIDRVSIRKEIQNKARKELDKQQRDYLLHQEIKTINEELGGTSHEVDIEEMREKAKKKKWSKDIANHFEKELSKLQRTNSHSPDYAVQRNYLDVLLELPWEYYSKDKFDLKRAEKILDEDHYGLEEIKKRILEHLSVLKLRNDMKSPILCFYGPPGVGKTSLGKSIAKALGREYVRMSLGGLRDEAEIRGHRKTYIGAMPGRVIQLLKKAGTSNPIFVLDEIDKLSNSYSGDPSSAMLEVLDPEQNNEFYDNFLEVGYDLSKVMFIATANDLSTIQPALLDRMEIINVTGYTLEEKSEIAKRHLLPRQIKEHGLLPDDVELNKEELDFIIDGYTRESGVRNLDKQIAKVVRSIAKNKAMEKQYNPKLSKNEIAEILGVARTHDLYENDEVAGVVTGLAWTSVGGDILFIESALSKGKGQLSITGNLGKVMKESATIALEYLKANTELYGIDPRLFEQYNVHLHFPEGATPKDGPSAGITILTSLVSLFTQKRVKKYLAMTGEITLRGKVLPVGGIKEKILAAKRAGIKEIILSKENEKDVNDIKKEYLKGLKFHFVSQMQEVIKIAITDKEVKNPKEISFETTK